MIGARQGGLLQRRTLLRSLDGQLEIPGVDARELAAGVAGARLVVLEDAGHVRLLTRPREVVDALADWWATEVHRGR